MSKTPYENVTNQNLTSATQLATINYTYSDSSWSDKLTAYDGQTIVYDASGNPTSYKGATLTWNGRLLTSYEKDDRRFEYTYNENGLRTGKKIYRDNVLGAVCRYIWDGDKLIGQKVEAVGDNTGEILIEYLYNNDEAVGIIINNSPYIFEKNIQGDVVGIHPACDDSLVIKFNYTAWGEIYFEQTNSLLVAIISALILPYLNITYRGYFCDHEIGLYYLQSRYYDPETGRFINADDTNYLAYDCTPVSMNLFTYCGNNPVNRIDATGLYHTVIKDMSIKNLVNAGISLSTTSKDNQKGLIQIVYYKQKVFDGIKSKWVYTPNKVISSYSYSSNGKYLILKYTPYPAGYFYQNVILCTQTAYKWESYLLSKYASKIEKAKTKIKKNLISTARKIGITITDKDIQKWGEFIDAVKDAISFSGIENPILNTFCFASDLISIVLTVVDYVQTHWITKMDKNIYANIKNYLSKEKRNYNIMILMGIDNYSFSAGRWSYSNTTYPY